LSRPSSGGDAGGTLSGAKRCFPDFELIVHGRRSSVAAGAKSEETRMLSTILIIVLILLLVGALPTWPYSSGWGYYPGGGLGLILVIVLVLALMGRI
jgi:Protein of unknown function (DUF3309)